MEELVAFVTGNLEADETETLSRDDWLLAFAAVNDGFKFHGSLPELCRLFLVGSSFCIVSRSIR
jgi:hypothetical protein